MNILVAIESVIMLILIFFALVVFMCIFIVNFIKLLNWMDEKWLKRWFNL